MMRYWEKIKTYFKRINQVLLVWPVWLVLGLSYLIGKHSERSGWVKSDKNENFEKMY